ncbi:uncharacterized protein LOC144355157 [Saccoglossus kowalevskii]
MLWKLELSWDKPLNDDLCALWSHISQDIEDSRSLNIKRTYFDTKELKPECELHAFADSSLCAYGAVIYLKHMDRVSLVTSKSRVAPLRDITLPRLELMAALIATRLSQYVLKALNTKYNITQCYLWGDNQIVIHWINGNKPLPVFVKNRVDEINRFDCVKKCVSTDDNPADLLTRGISFNLWWSGLSWLPYTDKWPVCPLVTNICSVR